MTSVRWPEVIDARLRVLVNMATQESGRGSSAAEVLAGLVIAARLEPGAARRTADTFRDADLEALRIENSRYAAQATPRRGRPRATHRPHPD